MGINRAYPLATLSIPSDTTLKRIHRIQAITIFWMAIEAGVALLAAWKAQSPALAAFGGDSAIELLSATVVLWRFRVPRAHPLSEQKAARIAGVLLLVLAAYVIAIAALTLLGHREPQTSRLGIALLIAAAVVMPGLARAKRRLSSITGSAALRADAAQSSVCAYLSLIALAGLVLHALFQWGWADPVAALALTPLIAWEGREALRGKPCECC
jgi:divalent metal cation (Fe/Co/Zn/Cd) transporter